MERLIEAAIKHGMHLYWDRKLSGLELRLVTAQFESGRQRSKRIAFTSSIEDEYHGTGKAHSIDEPLKTLTGTDVFGIAWPLVLKHADKLYLVDIYYRMLMPRELARGVMK